MATQPDDATDQTISGAYCEVCHKQPHTQERLDIHVDSLRHEENVVFAFIIRLYEQRRDICLHSLTKP